VVRGRLSPEDHKLLQLLCIGSGKSQNMLITELLHAEFDRALRGKRELVADGGPASPRPRPTLRGRLGPVGHQQLARRRRGPVGGVSR
jgi:hypothetical protein